MAQHVTVSPSAPIILAIENSSMCGSIALLAEGTCISEYSLSSKATHSKRLLAGIGHIIREAQFDWTDIDAIAVSLGPGSFTGLRIGLTTAKGLVMASGVKLIGVRSLDGLAAQLLTGGQLICPVIDARKKEVYSAFYRRATNGIIKKVSQTVSITPETLATGIKEPVVLLGDGSQLYKEVFAEILGDLVTFASPEIFYPRAAAIGLLALRKWHEKDFLNPISAAPIYVRPSDAELNVPKKR